MSQVMSGGEADASPDALAAEFVLGTLDSDERAHAQSLLSADEEFRAKVKVWERRLGELHLMVEPVEPDGQIWERIKAKMPPPPTPALDEPVAAVPEPAPGQPATVEAPAEIPAATPEKPNEAANEGRLDFSTEATASPAPDLVPAPDPTAASKPASTDLLVVPGVTRSIPFETRDRAAILGRRLGRWRAFALLMTVLVAAVAALLGLWRFAPQRLPAEMQPREVMRRIGVELPNSPPAPAARRAPPPASQFDE